MKLRVASAGTGKTTSLVRRYLELIGAGTPLRRLAGVTFTGVGAAELRTRVRAGVAEVGATGRFLDLAFPPEHRPRFEEAALELSGATLTTIHGFMAAALRLNAPLLGLDPDFGALGEWEARALFEEELATLRFLARAPEHALHAPLQRLAGGRRRSARSSSRRGRSPSAFASPRLPASASATSSRSSKRPTRATGRGSGRCCCPPPRSSGAPSS